MYIVAYVAEFGQADVGRCAIARIIYKIEQSEIWELFCLLGFHDFFFFAISWALRTFYRVWVKPKRMEKYLGEQGINGPPYKIFYGNLKEMVGMVIEARSRPMELSHRYYSTPSSFLLSHG
ncbi:hypothetical protein IFM89_004761 [Coptis chinensis]|uniref:Cytochrome P450 n=1 Tax=Coptis chinensis TaxID=261450 RepID=A0A835HIY9_9MAGN|nr:hypothetical protein IFM89_004761 [Coptis chinensis]